MSLEENLMLRRVTKTKDLSMGTLRKFDHRRGILQHNGLSLKSMRRRLNIFDLLSGLSWLQRNFESFKASFPIGRD